MKKELYFVKLDKGEYLLRKTVNIRMTASVRDPNNGTEYYVGPYCVGDKYDHDVFNTIYNNALEHNVNLIVEVR